MEENELKWFFSKCAASFGYLPTGRLTNAALATEFSVSADRVLRHTGITARAIANPSQCASDLAYEAASCFVKINCPSGINLHNLEALIVATTSPDMPSPATAHHLHAKLGLAQEVHCFDVSSSCTSFLSALRVGLGVVQRQVLVVATECKQKTLNQSDLRTRSLFGDGAAGVLLEPSDGSEAFAFPYVCSDSAAVHRIQIPVGGSLEPHSASNAHRAGLQLNDPKSTFALIVSQFVLAIQAAWEARRSAIAQSGINPDLVLGTIYLHQANANILQQVKDRFPQCIAIRIPILMVDIGNLVCASLPMVRLRHLSQGSNTQESHMAVGPNNDGYPRIDIWCASGGGMQTIAVLHAQNISGLK